MTAPTLRARQGSGRLRAQDRNPERTHTTPRYPRTHTTPRYKNMKTDTEQQQTFTTTAEADGTWRQKLPPVEASKTTYAFTFASSNSTAERAQMDDVLFGEVYLCGGQVGRRSL